MSTTHSTNGMRWPLLAGGCLLVAGIVAGVAALFLAGGVDKGADDKDSSPEELRFVLETDRESDAETTDQVDEAIDKGVAWLKKQLREGKIKYGRGYEWGTNALVGLTLLECGVSPTDAAVRRAIQGVYGKEGADGWKKSPRTYSIAIGILLLDRLMEHGEVDGAERVKHGKLLRTLALHLIANQHPTGNWTYDLKTLSAEEERQVEKAARAGTYDPADVLGKISTRHDNSLAQFAVLALWAAHKHDVPVAQAILIEEKRLRDQQNDDGSWDYGPGMRGTPAMTCSGLIGLAAAAGIRAEVAESNPSVAMPTRRVLDDPAVKRGLTYLGDTLEPRDDWKRWRELGEQLTAAGRLDTPEARRKALDDVHRQRKEFLADMKKKGVFFTREDKNPEVLYFLWSLERTAVIYGLDRFGDCDWYDWGRRSILARQKPDGHWRDQYPTVPDTCFALLFLRRSNLVQDLSARVQRARDSQVP